MDDWTGYASLAHRAQHPKINKCMQLAGQPNICACAYAYAYVYSSVPVATRGLDATPPLRAHLMAVHAVACGGGSALRQRGQLAGAELIHHCALELQAAMHEAGRWHAMSWHHRHSNHRAAWPWLVHTPGQASRRTHCDDVMCGEWRARAARWHAAAPRPALGRHACTPVPVRCRARCPPQRPVGWWQRWWAHPLPVDVAVAKVGHKREHKHAAYAARHAGHDRDEVALAAGGCWGRWRRVCLGHAAGRAVNAGHATAHGVVRDAGCVHLHACVRSHALRSDLRMFATRHLAL